MSANRRNFAKGLGLTGLFLAGVAGYTMNFYIMEILNDRTCSVGRKVSSPCN